jgi:endogenous inhibitor of DNA gyrase (YacG/DUF329 family)
MGETVRLRPRRPCPICFTSSIQQYHPFCSARCAQVDLKRWLGGDYAIPGEEPAAGEDAKPAADLD